MTQADKNIQAVNGIKARLNANVISYEQAKFELEPILEEMNKTAAEIAKKYGKKPQLFTAVGLLR